MSFRAYSETTIALISFSVVSCNVQLPTRFAKLIALRASSTIIHKLGYKTYSAIWLAPDKQRAAYAAVKVGTADARSYEAEILHALAGSQLGHPGRAMIPTIQDQFCQK
ncbi:hypothetical protein I7I51_04290 [Histoplasma capsulatum]|uniref:Uncharacterized protein n=1 Tax=Ajellomyces capsulatus TaxID=5037 RepID=A0A8A1MBL8_AJECA|nr:hypothetical protein I7I51_04290 [Histoplasma capsulatum]